MTTSVTLTTSWQEIADNTSFLATFDPEGDDVLVAFAASAPTSDDDAHVIPSTANIGGAADGKVFVKVPTGANVAKVSTFSGTVDHGIGLGLITVATGVAVVFR